MEENQVKDKFDHLSEQTEILKKILAEMQGIREDMQKHWVNIDQQLRRVATRIETMAK
jgi:hypothetical protein